jgi:hypothetical protein
VEKLSYSKYLISKPAREVGKGQPITGRENPTRTYISNDLVSGSNCYIEIGWINEMPSPNPHIKAHTHDYDEIVIHMGADPGNPDYLGAEIEFVVADEKIIIDKTSALFIPKGIKHGPLTWKKVEKPHIEMVVMPGAGTVRESNPAGYLP